MLNGLILSYGTREEMLDTEVETLGTDDAQDASTEYETLCNILRCEHEAQKQNIRWQVGH